MDVFRREEHVLAWLKQAGLRVSESGLPRLVFTTGNPCRATDAFRLGAVDYLLKPLEAEQVTEAVNRDRVRRYHNAQMEDLRLRYESLTPRERQVMHRVVSGLLNKQVAAELGTSEIRRILKVRCPAQGSAMGISPSAVCLACVSVARSLCQAAVKMDSFVNPRATPF